VQCRHRERGGDRAASEGCGRLWRGTHVGTWLSVHEESDVRARVSMPALRVRTRQASVHPPVAPKNAMGAEGAEEGEVDMVLLMVMVMVMERRREEKQRRIYSESKTNRTRRGEPGVAVGQRGLFFGETRRIARRVRRSRLNGGERTASCMSCCGAKLTVRASRRTGTPCTKVCEREQRSSLRRERVRGEGSSEADMLNKRAGWWGHWYELACHIRWWTVVGERGAGRRERGSARVHL
jgi:hypothetical protein